MEAAFDRKDVAFSNRIEHYGILNFCSQVALDKYITLMFVCRSTIAIRLYDIIIHNIK